PPTSRDRVASAGWGGCRPRRDADTTRPTPWPHRWRDRGRRRSRPVASGCPAREGAAPADRRRGPCGATIDAAGWQPRRRRGPRSGGAGLFQAGDEAGHAQVVPAGDELDRLLVVERLERLGEPDGDVVRRHDASQPLDEGGELGDALRPQSGGLAPEGEPAAHRAARGARGPGDELVAQVTAFVDAAGLLRKGGGHGVSRLTIEYRAPSRYRQSSIT